MARHLCLRKLWLVSNKDSSIAWKNLAENSYSEGSHLGNRLSITTNECSLALQSLSEVGYYVFQQSIDEDLVNDFVAFSDSLGFNVENESQQPSTRISYDEIDSGKSLRYLYDDRVYNHNLVNCLLKDSALISLVEEHLKTNKISIYGKGWKSIGRPNISLSQASNAAQMFHFDYDSMNFLKIFVYLTDVCDKSGPHEFIAGSNKPFNSDLITNNIKPYGRYTDQAIVDIFKKKPVRFTGKKGTVIIEDTSGFHKGNILDHGQSRDILTLTAVDSII